jgi:hypothetical protein
VQKPKRGESREEIRVIISTESGKYYGWKELAKRWLAGLAALLR